MYMVCARLTPGAPRLPTAVRETRRTTHLLLSDLTIIELVDEHDDPVPAGTPSARVLVTNLCNTQIKGIERTVEFPTLQAELERALSYAYAGVPNPQISLTVVDHIDPDLRTGKVRRWVPLKPRAEGAPAR